MSMASDVPIWLDPPKMCIGSSQPCVERLGDDLWVAYRTRTDDHFAVVRFTQTREFSFGDPNHLTRDSHSLWLAGLAPHTFHQVRDAALEGTGLRRWIVTFHNDTLDVVARGAEIVVRAIQAPSGTHALAMAST